MSRKVFTHIDTHYDIADILKKSGICQNTPEYAELQGALTLIERHIRPRGVIRRCILDNRKGSLFLNGMPLRSGPLEALLRSLTGKRELVLGVLTAGEEIDYIGTVTLEKVFNALKLATLTSALEYIAGFLKAEWDYKEVGWLNPGVLEELPIQENRQLFRIVGNVFEDIGVDLSENCLMIPEFTVSAIFYEKKHPYDASAPEL